MKFSGAQFNDTKKESLFSYFLSLPVFQPTGEIYSTDIMSYQNLQAFKYSSWGKIVGQTCYGFEVIFFLDFFFLYLGLTSLSVAGVCRAVGITGFI